MNIFFRDTDLRAPVTIYQCAHGVAYFCSLHYRKISVRSDIICAVINRNNHRTKMVIQTIDSAMQSCPEVFQIRLFGDDCPQAIQSIFNELDIRR